jgi:hypothetical protein
MKANLTDFQREFRRAREAADRGVSVIIEAGDRKYVCEVLGVQGNGGNEGEKCKLKLRV